MSYESNRTITLLPHVANVILKNRFVSIGTGGLVDESTAAADAVGVSREQSDADNSIAIPVTLLDGGKVEVEAGAAVTIGVRVMSDSTGRAITATGATARVLGIAISGGATGDFLTIVGLKAAGEFVS
ncbi:MAG: DUF2190 family protein [Desulfocapsa sp.]|nr:DUF2190 family protein [Desulfocapsa sp.]